MAVVPPFLYDNPGKARGVRDVLTSLGHYPKGARFALSGLEGQHADGFLDLHVPQRVNPTRHSEKKDGKLIEWTTWELVYPVIVQVRWVTDHGLRELIQALRSELADQ